MNELWMLSFKQDLMCYLDFKWAATQLQLTVSLMVFYSQDFQLLGELWSIPGVNIQFVYTASFP